jgi:hypothetical protein
VYNGAVHQLFIDFQKTHYSVKRKVLYNILNKSDTSIKLDVLIKKHLYESYGKIHAGKYLYDVISHPEWSETKSCFTATEFQLCFRIHHYEGPIKSGGIGNEWNTSVSGLCW